MSFHPTLRGFGRRRVLAAVAGAALAAGAALSAATPATAAPAIRNLGAADAIAGQYIVVYRDTKVSKAQSPTVTARLATRHRAVVTQRYSTALRGFAGRLSLAEAKRLAADPAVAYVEQDTRVTASATQSPTPSYGLDRIDQRALPLNGSYTYATTASDVTAYIIDTGIRTTHSDFGGRAVWGTNTSGDGRTTDCNGHGTHVAGTVGGNAYGVAKGVRLVAVKVLTCGGSGTNSGVIAGVDWVTANHTSGPAVANMSLGGIASTAIDNAVANSIADGVFYAVAAGNDNANACNYSPARTSAAVTVGATTRTDARASYSNYGTCLDIFAPGSDITSAWYPSDTATNTISGTSMATPHVAGAAALILASTPTASPAAVTSTLIANATPNVVTNPGTGSPNRLLFTSPPANACPARTNATDYPINDNSTVNSPISVTGCGGYASATTSVEVHIVHTYRGDLGVSLIAPDGSIYTLLNRVGGSADNVDQTFTVNASSEVTNGTWNLRVTDNAGGDTGYIDSWTIDP